MYKYKQIGLLTDAFKIYDKSYKKICIFLRFYLLCFIIELKVNNFLMFDQTLYQIKRFHLLIKFSKYLILKLSLNKLLKFLCILLIINLK